MAGERQLGSVNTRQWSKLSRTAKRAASNLGVIMGAEMLGKTKKFRSSKLDHLDAYYERTQYDHLKPWDCNECTPGDSYVPVAERKPKLNYAFAKVLCQRVTSKLFGNDTFPALTIEEDPEAQLFISMVVESANLKSKLLEPIRRALNSGSSFVRFYVVAGTFKVEHFLGKYCYPEFDEAGDLESIRIQYVYCDPLELDQNGKQVKKWYRLDLSTMTDVLYDNPPYNENSEPEFKVEESVSHGLGFVQGQWFRTSEDKHSPDGYSLIDDVLEFIDSINYSLSQSDQAVKYNQDPQLLVSGMDADGIDNLIKSSTKAWNLGREGKGEFLESSLTGVEKAEELRVNMDKKIQDVARIVFLDPEKFSAQAQSGKAMEVLHGPLVELVNELRPVFGPQVVNLVLKMTLLVLLLAKQGEEIPVEIPPGWQPSSLNIVPSWPPIFPPTMEDLQKKVSIGVSVASGNIISRETITKWLAKDFGILDIEAEVAKVAAQPVINPFGGF